jgi:hypothetical protein
MAKKYSSYNVKITYTNGDTEDITLKGINTSDYKEMIKVYNDVKEDHKNDSCIIDFVGVNDSGELGILFTKEINTKITDEDKLKMKVEDIVPQISILLETLKLKREYHNKSQSVDDKKQDIKLHDLDITNEDEDILAIAKEIQDIRKQRREDKDEILFLSFINNIDSMLNKFKEVNNRIVAVKGGEKFSSDTVEKYNIIKEVTYRSDKERISLMSQLKPKYDKFVIDELNKKITFYNKGYTNKKNRKKAM